MPRVAKEKKPVSIVDRRLASGSIFAASSRPIPLVDEHRWTLRIVNAGISEQRIWEMQADKGWVYAEPADIAVDVTELGFRVLDGKIVRGTQGTEVLMKMERADYKKIQAMKDKENRQRTFGSKQLKRDILAQAAGEIGEQGAEFLARNMQRVTVTDSKEVVTFQE